MRTIKIYALLLVCTVFLAQTSFAQKNSKESINGEGSTVKQELNIDRFHTIGLGVPAKVYVSKGAQKVTIEAQRNIIDNIETDVKDGSWSIEFDKRVRKHAEITIYITMPTVEGLAIGGSGEIIGKDNFNGLSNLNISIGGSGEIEFAGSANTVEISIAGSGTVKTGDLKSKNCTVNIAGSGEAYVEASEDLDVSIAGSGDVRYKGSPKVSKSIAGSGSVRSM